MGAGVIVADTNVVAYLLIKGAHTAAAEAARKRDAAWHVPSLFIHEWLNVVTLHVSAGLFDRDRAVRVYRRGLAVVRIEARPIDPVRIFNLHAASGCSSYDCQFVDLADKLNVRLVTADAEVIRSCPQVAIGFEEFAAGG